MLRRPRTHLTYANAAATLALVIAVGTGGAYAANTVFSSDIVDGEVKSADISDTNGVRGVDVQNASLGLADLSADSRTHMIDYSAPGVDPPVKRTIATVGNLRLSGQCTVTPSLYITLKNLKKQVGTMNVSITSQDGSNGPVQLFTSGQFVGPGEEFTIDNNDDTNFRPVAINDFHRAEGQVVFRTPGRVTTINFHGFTVRTGGERCEFYGTAVTSDRS